MEADASDGRKMEGEAAHCWGRNVVGSTSQVTGAVWLLVVSHSSRIPPQLIEKYPNVTSHRSPQVVCFLVVCGGDSTHTLQ